MKNYTHKAMVNRLIRECDKLWRRIILLRSGRKCEICGKTQPVNGEILWIQACHIISRTYWSTRWDPKNGIGACQHCHNHRTIMEWLARTDPKRYEWVIATRQKQVNHRDIDLEKVLAYLRAVA